MAVSTYEQGVQRLIDRISAMDNGWSPTPLNKEMKALSKRLNELADDLDGASFAWSEIEAEHDKEPLKEFGTDGLPVAVENWHCSYQATLGHMRALADSANRAADGLPNSRVRHALPFAAMGLLHLKVWHGQQIGSIDVDSQVVVELESICQAASIVISREAFRNALITQRNQFDPHVYPPGIFEIIDGR